MKKIELPKNWYIKGCIELRNLCDKHVANILGNYKNCIYYNYTSLSDDTFWRRWENYIDENEAKFNNAVEIPFDLFLKYLNGESEESDDLQPLVKLLNNINNE